MNTPVNYSSLEDGNPFRDRDDDEEGGVIIHQVPETKGNAKTSYLIYVFLGSKIVSSVLCFVLSKNDVTMDFVLVFGWQKQNKTQQIVNHTSLTPYCSVYNIAFAFLREQQSCQILNFSRLPWKVQDLYEWTPLSKREFQGYTRHASTQWQTEDWLLRYNSKSRFVLNVLYW